ncbi:MAG: lysoplasmalogenase [Clostridia bacterium]|nr:lysoplasmalogenase [Clostridia bacterium]
MVVSIIIASVLVVVFLGFRVMLANKNNTWGVITTLIKAAASCAVIAIAVTAIYAGGKTGVGTNRTAIFMVAGLIFGLIGDIVLDLKVVYLKTPEEGAYLYGGMISFGLGHILYFVALILFFGGAVISWSMIGICLAVSAVVAFLMIILGEKLMKLNFGKFTIISIIYAFVLLFMTAISIALWAVAKKNELNNIPLLSIGYILFLLSDLVLTTMYFGGRGKDNTLCVINHLLYYAAQICIATFVFFMQ